MQIVVPVVFRDLIHLAFSNFLIELFHFFKDIFALFIVVDRMIQLEDITMLL